MVEFSGASAASDAELIARAKDGEADAFGELYQRYLGPIYGYIRLRVATDVDAEDLSEMVFLRSFEALGKYEERGAPFAAFLYRVARNAIADHYRLGEPISLLEDMERLGTGDEHGEKRIIQEELLNQVLQALSGLPERHREIIRLRLLMDLPTETVARWLGRKPAYVRVRLHRALEALRKKVGDIDDRV